MENLKNIHDFLTEKKVPVKRRYTEAHPAKNVSTAARVRSSILEAIADGHITEEEMAKILTELKAHNRWLDRNSTLFNISEDQEGVKTFSLSPYGQRVMNATKITVITEKKVPVRRRYTEAHPAKNVSTAARVRSSILEAIADGCITETEMSRILIELKAHNRWLDRNSTLFNISEDQEGVKTFSLSPYGQRVMNATKITVINEALSVPHKEQGNKPVNIFVGRFQPFTLGHVKVFEKMYKENGYPVVVYIVRGRKPDPEKSPFDEDLQQAMFAKMQKQYPFLEASYVVPNGAIDTLYSTARPAYEPMMWGFGTDRKSAYSGMIDKQAYRDQLGVHPDFKGFEIQRGDENISASKVRNAIKIDDEKTFKQMTPKSIHSFYKTLQNTLSPIKENKNNNSMKHLKSINEFTVNESDKVNVKQTIK